MSLLDRLRRLITLLAGKPPVHADECDGADCTLHDCGQVTP